MLFWLERLNIINMSMCLCQWVLCEADIEMELGVHRVYLGVTYVTDKREAGERQPAMHIWQGFSQSSDEFQSKKCALQESCPGKTWPDTLIPPLYSVTGGSLPGKGMALAWKLRWTLKVLTAGGSAISALHAAVQHVLSWSKT